MYGWRVLHKSENAVYIVSAGSPERVTSTEDDSEATKKSLNKAALKYCNTSYLAGGVCDSSTAHALNGDDFYKFTSGYYGNENARYLYNYNDGGTHGEQYCESEHSNTYCGYNNDMIDNGSSYWFASGYDSKITIDWKAEYRMITAHSTANTFGLRPVLKLDSTVKATGGTGTMTNPYTISERVVSE